jgi:hypothetical protein
MKQLVMLYFNTIYLQTIDQFFTKLVRSKAQLSVVKNDRTLKYLLCPKDFGRKGNSIISLNSHSGKCE